MKIQIQLKLLVQIKAIRNTKIMLDYFSLKCALLSKFLKY